MRLRDKVALISGAGGPMGRAIADRFAAEGASLMLNDISGTRLGEAVDALSSKLAAGAGLESHRADVTQEAEADALVARGRAAFEQIDILVNVVGGIRGALFEPLSAMSVAHWDDTLDLNLKGTFHLSKRIGPMMVDRGYGRIVNFASISYAGEGGQAHYGAAKAAIAAMTRAMAIELAPGVNVNCVAPGLINTSVIDRMPRRAVKRFIDQTLLGRLGEAAEIANAVLFLASDEASFITGEILVVSGGIWPAL